MAKLAATSSTPPPPRLHVLLARDSRRALILRRGPATHVASILWDRSNDTFTLGQWLKGRIYEERCDISPDGTHWIYFARHARWRPKAPQFWTAVARVPYLKALAFYPQGDAWGGGGLFVADRKYFAATGPTQDGDREVRELKRVEKPPAEYSRELPSPFHVRLVRNGWIHRPELSNPNTWTRVFERPLSHGWTLRFTDAWRRAQYELVRGDETLPLPDWEWGDVDGKRLVWTAAGVLYKGQSVREGVHVSKSLYDFNGMKFEAIAAPY